MIAKIPVSCRVGHVKGSVLYVGRQKISSLEIVLNSSIRNGRIGVRNCVE